VFFSRLGNSYPPYCSFNCHSKMKREENWKMGGSGSWRRQWALPLLIGLTYLTERWA
jgi:hypothetical protein